MNSIEEKKKSRLLFLKKTYELTDGDTMSYLSGFDIGEKIRFENSKTTQIVDYLVNEGFLKYAGLGGAISITHEGVKEVELGLENPNKPTQHFPPQVSIIKVDKMINSQIQQNSDNSIVEKTIKDNVYIGNLNESKSRGYRAGGVSFVIGIIIWIMVFQFGWEMTGQILSVFASAFTLLGVGSIIKPESIGMITAQILENMAENQSEGKETSKQIKKAKKKRKK